MNSNDEPHNWPFIVSAVTNNFNVDLSFLAADKQGEREKGQLSDGCPVEFLTR